MSDRIPNPRYPGSPARMSDGRLFTNYRPNCNKESSFEAKERRQQSGQTQIHIDRAMAAKRAATVGCVDTMVPELTKRVCTWNGCTTIPAQAVGIGQGRLYLPARTDLVEDPDALATKTAFPFGTFPVKTPTFVPTSPVTDLPPTRNRYSAPYQ